MNLSKSLKWSIVKGDFSSSSEEKDWEMVAREDLGRDIFLFIKLSKTYFKSRQDLKKRSSPQNKYFTQACKLFCFSI
jgi:hypothetical protein